MPQRFPLPISASPQKLAIILNPKTVNKKLVLQIDFGKCLDCTTCQLVCPVKLAPYKDKKLGVLQSDDCLRCGTCIANCPTKALNFKLKN